jgi:uncharacterized membrane protein
MTAYELYVFMHVAGAVVWIGSAFLMALLELRASAARDPGRAVGFARDAEWLGLRLFLPANLVVLASAFLVVEEGGWGYDHLWIKLGFAGFVLSFLIGAFFLGPGWARVGKLADQEGADSLSVHAAIRRLTFGTRVDLGILLGVLFAMTVKPTADDAGALAVTVAIPAAFTVLAYVLYRKDVRRVPEAQVAVESP